MILSGRQAFSISVNLSSPYCVFKSVSPNLSYQRILHAVRPSALPFPAKEWTL